MSSKTKAILSIILFIAILGGLKLVYDSRTQNAVIADLEGNGTVEDRTKPNESGSQATKVDQTDTTGSGTTPTSTRRTIPLPEITVFDPEGNPVKLSSFKGKKLVINAWASWCGPCKAEMPDFEALDEEAEDYQIVMVNIPGGLETRENSDKFLKDNQLEFSTMLYDNDLELSMALEITSIPTSIFVDAEGNIHYYQQGMMTKMQVQSALATIE